MGIQAWVESASVEDVRRWLKDPDACLEDQPSHRQIRLDRDWDALHFLLTESAKPGRGPLTFLARGGRAVAGGANQRLFRPTAVRSIQAALSSLPLRVCRERFNPLVLVNLDVYLGSWDVDTPGLLFERLKELKAFVRTGSCDGGDRFKAAGRDSLRLPATWKRWLGEYTSITGDRRDV